MNRPYNFSPGPAILPQAVLKQMRDELLDWQGGGMSVMEISHRGRDFVALAKQSEVDLRQLLAIPEHYHVLFMQGGASAQFSMVPLNLARPERRSADYVDTGHWSAKAIKEGQRLLERAEVVASSRESGYCGIPDVATWVCHDDAAYLHYTPNETIHGVEFHHIPAVPEGVPLVADMSSNLLSRPLEIERFGLIYAGAQKNIGPAGLTLVIVRDDLVGQAQAKTPALYDYAAFAQSDSMLNTPPTFAWYAAALVFRWLLDQGGVEAIEAINCRKAQKLYDCIDQSGGFYHNAVDPSVRSRMNVPFTLADSALDQPFLEQAAVQGLLNLKGHRAVGGMRASLYNAMPEEGVDGLVDFMQDFARRA